MEEQEVKCKSWEDFKNKIEELEITDGQDHFRFRGQGDAEWFLETTLERVIGSKKISMREYFKTMFSIKDEIKSSIDEPFQIKKVCQKKCVNGCNLY